MKLQDELAAALGAGYTVETEIAAGGMSRLFLAVEHALERRVVVKVVQAEAGQVLSIERFRREVALAASLQHPHIVAVLGAGAVAGRPYFIMPYVEGQSLRRRLEQAGAMPLKDAVLVLRDVARACAYAHARGVIHRDIKPDNILLAGGSAVITDFGVAKALAPTDPGRDVAGAAAAGAAPLTHDGIALGTPGYMAPEQVAGDPAIDQRADVYAFGIVAYEMLTGHAPFEGRTPHALLAAQLTEAPPPILDQRADVPGALAALVMRCLEKDRDARPSSAELVEALEHPSLLSGPYPATVSLKVRRRVCRRLAISGAALAVLAGGGLALWTLAAPRASAAASVAILPIENQDADTAQYLAQGLTDEITLAVSRIPGLQTASRGAVALWQGATPEPREVRRRLGVSAMLEGSLRLEKGKLRLFVQLTDTRTGLALWSQRFGGVVANVFALQDSIAQAVAVALGEQLRGSAPRGATAPRGVQGTSDVAAYDAFLRGRYLFARRTEPALREAVTHFERALALDPGFARALAGLADIYTTLPLYSRIDADSARSLALDYVSRAIALDSNLADALASRGSLYAALWRWREAEADLRRALALDSANANAWQWLGEWALVHGRSAEAERAFGRAAALEPLAAVPVALRALALGLLGRDAEAAADAQRAVATDSASFVPWLMQGVVLLNAGRAAAAIAPLERARRLGGELPSVVGHLGYAWAAGGRRSRAVALRDSVLARVTDPGATSVLMHVALGLGDTAQALTWLEWSAGARDPLFASEPLASPMFDPLRRSSRFAQVMRRVGLSAS